MKLLLIFGAFFVFFGAWAAQSDDTQAGELGGYFVVTGVVLLLAYAVVAFFQAPCVLPSEQ